MQDFWVYLANDSMAERWLNTSASQIAVAQSTQRRLMARGERRSPGAGSCKLRKIPRDGWKHEREPEASVTAGVKRIFDVW